MLNRKNVELLLTPELTTSGSSSPSRRPSEEDMFLELDRVMNEKLEQVRSPDDFPLQIIHVVQVNGYDVGEHTYHKYFKELGQHGFSTQTFKYGKLRMTEISYTGFEII